MYKPDLIPILKNAKDFWIVTNCTTPTMFISSENLFFTEQFTSE